jgi:hypothetical protein
LSTIKPASLAEALNVLAGLANTRPASTTPDDYRRRVATAKPTVEKALVDLPEGELRKTVRLALDACADASLAWDGMKEIDFMVEGEQVKPFAEKYPLKAVPISPGSPNKVYKRSDVLNAIWGRARERVSLAYKLASN